MFIPGWAVANGVIEEAPDFLSVLSTAGGQMFFSLSLGWALLCALTAGIGYLWLCPYQEAAQASFYRQICWERSNGQPDPGDFHQQTQFGSQGQQNRYNNRGPEL